MPLPALAPCFLQRKEAQIVPLPPGWPRACPITLSSPLRMPTISVLAYGACLMGLAPYLSAYGAYSLQLALPSTSPSV
eukprot:874315-Pyramimonas_sp.AAC.1